MLVAHLDRFGARRFSGSGDGASRFGVGVRGSGGVLKRVGAAEPAAMMAERLEPRLLLALVEWDGGAGTDSWHDALNWSGDAVPTAVDDVVIGESEVVVRVAGAIATARSLTTSVDMLVLASLTVEDRVDLHARMTLGSGATGGHLRFATGSNSIITGTGEIYLDYAGQAFGASVGQYGGALTIESGVTVRGGGGQIRVDSGDLILRGEVRADVPDRALMVHATSNNASVRVEGLVQSTAGVMQLAGDSVYFDGDGTMKSAGGRMELWGIVQNAGRVFTLAAESGDIYLRYGGFAGGVVRSGGASGFRVDGSLGWNVIVGLDGVHLEAPMWVYNNAEVRIYDGLTLDGALTLGRGATGATFGRMVFWNSTSVQSLAGSGEIVFDHLGGSRPEMVSNYLSAAQNVQLTIEEGITIRGRGGMIRAEQNAVITTYATISSDAPGYLYIGQSYQFGMIVSHGRLDASNGGILDVGPYTGTRVALGEGTTFTANGGRVRVRGLNIEAGEPLYFDAEVGTLEISYSTIVGSVISSRGGVVAFGNNTILDGVTLSSLSEVFGAVSVRNGLTLHAAMSFVMLPLYSGSGALTFVTTTQQSLAGAAGISAAGVNVSANILVGDGVGLTIGDGISIGGSPATVRTLGRGSSIMSFATMAADTSGKTFSLVAAIGSSIELGGELSLTDGGILSFSGGGVISMGASMQLAAGAGQMRISTSTVVDLGGRTLVLSDAGTTLRFERGEVRNASLHVADVAALTLSGVSPLIAVLRDIEVIGEILVAGPSLREIHLLGSTSFERIVITAAGSTVFFDDDDEVDGEIIVKTSTGTALVRIRAVSAGAELTLAPCGVIRLEAPSSAGVGLGSGASSLFINRGTIDFSALPGSTVTRTVSVAGTLLNEGHIRLGARIVLGVALFEQGGDGALVMGIDGAAVGRAARMNAMAGIALAGSFAVEHELGFLPARGFDRRLIHAPSAEGTFSSVVTPSLADPDLKSPVLIDAQGVRLIVTHIADFNNDLVVNDLDIFAFLNDWFAGGGDFDGNGERTVSDIFVFLSAWYRA